MKKNCTSEKLIESSEGTDRIRKEPDRIATVKVHDSVNDCSVASSIINSPNESFAEGIERKKSESAMIGEVPPVRDKQVTCRACLEEEITCKYCYQVVSTLDHGVIIREQDNDPVIAIIKEKVQEGNLPPWSEIAPHPVGFQYDWNRFQSLVLKDNILYYLTESSDGNTRNYQIILPKSLVELVLTELHNSTTGGHLGVYKTTEKVKQRFFWYAMTADIDKEQEVKDKANEGGKSVKVSVVKDKSCEEQKVKEKKYKSEKEQEVKDRTNEGDKNVEVNVVNDKSCENFTQTRLKDKLEETDGKRKRESIMKVNESMDEVIDGNQTNDTEK